MWHSLLNFLKAPVFSGDEEKTRRARALNALLLNMGFALLVLGSVGVLFVFAEKVITSGILLFGLLVTCTGFWLNQRGNVQAGGIILLVTLWLMAVLMACISGGIRSLDIIFFISVTVMAGILLGNKGAYIVAGLSLLAGLVLALAERAGFVFPLLFKFPPLSVWIILFINLVFTVTPLQVTLQSLSASALRARLSEERYRLIASVMSDYAFSIQYGPNGEITDQWLSGAFEMITGYSAEEYFARGGWRSILYPDDRAQDERDMTQLRANHTVSTEVRILKKDGSIRWVRAYGQPLWDEKNNRLTGIYGAVQDITASKQVDGELRQHAEEVTLLFRLSTALAGGQNLYQALRAFVRELKQVITVDAFHIGLYDEATDVFSYSLFLNLDEDIQPPSRKLRDRPGLTWEVISSRQTIYLQDIADPQTQREHDIVIVIDAGLRSYIGIPLMLQERVIGVMSVQALKVNAYSPSQLRLLETIAAQVTGTIEKLGLFEQLQQELAERARTEAELQEREAILEVVADAANTFLKISAWSPDTWRIEVDNLLERLGTTINASHAYVFENHLFEDGSTRTSMRNEWTTPGYDNDLENPKYTNMPMDEDNMESWNKCVPHGLPYIGDAEHLPLEDINKLRVRGIHALLDVPIFVDGKWWGTIGFDEMTHARNWSTAEVGTLVVASNMLSAAIKRVQLDSTLQNELTQRQTLIKELETKHVESETLRESTAIIAATLDVSETVQRVLEQLKRIVQYDVASVWLYQDGKAILMGAHNLPPEVSPEGEYILSYDAPDHNFWANEAEALPYFLLDNVGDHYPIFRDPPLDYIKAWLGVSLWAGGKLMGYIALDSSQPAKFNKHDAEMAVSFAEQVSIALEKARLFGELQEKFTERQMLIEELELRNSESETLRESAAIVAATLNQSEAIARILEQLERVVHYNSASVQLLTGDMLEIVSSRGLDFNKDDIGMQFLLNESEPSYPVFQGDAPYILYEDIQASIPEFNEIPHNNIRTWMAIPLKVKGQIIGIIALDGQQVGQFTARDANLAVTYANQVAVALENARLFSELQDKFAERQKLIDELENKNAELERFTYTVSHDLRSPLVTIKGFLGYLEKDASLGNMENFRKDMARISGATDRMDNLLKDVLELSRIGRLVNKPKDIPFATLVAEAVEIVHGRLDARKITLQTQPDLPIVHVDKPRLVEVLQNLIDNAAKYMGDQTDPLIIIGAQGGLGPNGYQTFFVQDNGMGIDPQFHERIFGLFDKLDVTSEGTGIGLALVKRIIEFHGGRIWVESEVGQGSTFYFTLQG